MIKTNAKKLSKCEQRVRTQECKTALWILSTIREHLAQNDMAALNKYIKDFQDIYQDQLLTLENIKENE